MMIIFYCTFGTNTISCWSEKFLFVYILSLPQEYCIV